MSKGDWLINDFDTLLFVCDVHDPSVGLIREEYEEQFLGEFHPLEEDESAPLQHWEEVLGVRRPQVARGVRSLPQLVTREQVTEGGKTRISHRPMTWDPGKGVLTPVGK